jgi:hypothetical protein
MQTPKRRRYPAIPSDLLAIGDVAGLNRILAALRERAEIVCRDRGPVDDSMVRVDDLIKLGLITRSDLDKLRD